MRSVGRALGHCARRLTAAPSRLGLLAVRDRQMWKPIIAAAMLAGLAGCSAKQDADAATAQITAFHQQLDAGNFDAVYENADPIMKASASETTLVQILAAVHRKLGNFKSGSAVGWNENLNPQGRFMSVNYSAKYERGDATENFVYRIDSAPARLVGYHINSTALILN